MLQEREFVAAPGLSHAALAWYGNAAKMRVIERIAAERRPCAVLDYGAGDGQGWSHALYQNRDIELTCYEPDAARAKELRRNVPAAHIHDGEPSGIAGRFDVIVSFSVLEHVYDRAAYLAHARRLLKPDGCMFLNYDDGHFRTPGSRIEALRNRLAPLLPWLGLTRHYQSSVRPREADRLVAEAGFAVASDRYENLPALKALSRAVPHASRGMFAQAWIETEDRLNAICASTDLWHAMGSRTMELRHAVTR